MIKIKRIYNGPTPDDGLRILVDRLWPRGLRKEKAKVDLWLKEVAPSDELRKWYAHDPKKWLKFKEKYFKELGHKRDFVNLVLKKTKEGNLTLLFGSKEEKFNNAVALKEYMIEHGTLE
jgi:uncharacterized protein YeaO (DUF488 family)